MDAHCAEDENFVQQELNVTKDLLDKVTLTPKQSTAWHFSGTLVNCLLVGTVIMLTVFVCRPGSAMKCKMVCCSCCGRKQQDQEVALEELRV